MYVIGRLHCVRNKDNIKKWYYGDLFVIPEYRRMGIATQMIEKAKNHLSEIGAQSLCCYVEPDNVASRQLQKSVVFVTDWQKNSACFKFVRVYRDISLKFDKFCDIIKQILKKKQDVVMKKTFKKTLSVLLLFTAAIVWGVAFVAQSKASDVVAPFTFISARFLLGSAALLPVIGLKSMFGASRQSKSNSKILWKGGALCGIALAVASALQQIGIEHTTVGKAGFITALYILIVPIFGLFLRKRVSLPLWIGVVLAAVGVYLLCVTERFTVANGDWYVLGCAFCFSIHILFVDHFVAKVDGVKLACIQFFVCGIVSLVPALIFESPSFEILKAAAGPIIYAGLVSSAIGYTLQILGQKHVSPALASLIMSLESVFAALAGWILLPGETYTNRELIGCVLMFIAITVAQINPKKE